MTATCCDGGCPVCEFYNSRIRQDHILKIKKAIKELEEEDKEE